MRKRPATPSSCSSRAGATRRSCCPRACRSAAPPVARPRRRRAASAAESEGSCSRAVTQWGGDSVVLGLALLCAGRAVGPGPRHDELVASAEANEVPADDVLEVGDGLGGCIHLQAQAGALRDELCPAPPLTEDDRAPSGFLIPLGDRLA